MSDEDALLSAIIANPDEDTPRLAFADWLDEHDQPERAEFIRLQIEAARLAIDEPRAHEIGRRVSQLLGQHRKAWVRPLRELLPSARLEFRRGFIEEIEAEATIYARSATDINRLSPVREVLLRNCSNLCELNRLARLDRTRLTALVIHSQWGVQRRTITLLRQAPDRLEQELTNGDWLVLVWSVWSGPDTLAVQQLGRVLRSPLLNDSVRFALRPFDEFEEFRSWCPTAPEFSSPLWVRFTAGNVVSHQVGHIPPDPLREVWS